MKERNSQHRAMTFSCCKFILLLQTCLPFLQVQTCTLFTTYKTLRLQLWIVASTTNSRPTRDTLDEGSSIQGHSEDFVNKRIQYLPSPERTREKTRAGHRRESRACVSPHLDAGRRIRYRRVQQFGYWSVSPRLL